MAPTDTNGKSKQYNCLACKQVVKRSQTCVPCQVCEEYTHPECSGISKDLLKYLVEETNGGNSISWTCDHCTKVGKALNNKVKALNKEIMEIRKEVSGLKLNQDTMETELREVKSKCDGNAKDIKNATERVQKSIYAELRERELKKSNVILHGVPEPEAALQGGARKDHDMEWILKVSDSIGVNLKQEAVKFVTRLGSIREETDRVRPLLVGLKEYDKKMALLKNAWKLCETEEYNEIYLTPDLTKQQREEEQELEREVRQKNAELDEQTALNSEWRLVGPRGEKRIVLTTKKTARMETTRGRPMWRGRGRGGVRGRGAENTRGETRKRQRTPEIMERRTRQSVADQEEMERGLEENPPLQQDKE